MSFFGFGGAAKKQSTPSSTGSPSDSVDTSKLISPVYDTGRNVDDIVLGLLNTLNDSEAAVRSLMHKSLLQIGDNEPVLVLSKSLGFLNKLSKSQKGHRVLVMNMMSECLDKNVELKLPDDLATGLVIMSVLEIVAEKSISSEWQNAACKLLISLSRLAPDIVAKQLLERFPSTSPPHYFIVKAFADFAYTYPHLFLPHCKEVVSRSLPILASLKQDNLKWVFCAGLGRWAEAVVRCKKESKNNIPTSEYSSAMHAAIKHMLNDWLVIREPKIRLAASEAIGYMSHIIETNHLNELLKPIIAGLLGMMRKEAKGEQLPVTIGLKNVIYVVVRDCSASLSEHLEILMKELMSYLPGAVKMENTSQKAKQNLHELLSCFEYIGKQYTDQVVSFFQRHTESKEPLVKLTVLRAFKHMVSNLDIELASYKDVLVSGLKLFTQYEDTKIHLEYARLIHEMAKHNYLQSLGGTDLVTVVIQGASISDDAIARQAKSPQPIPSPTLEELRTECDDILSDFASDLGEYMDPVLWPFLMEHLIPFERTASFSILCKCISDIAKRKKNDDDFIIDYDRTVNVPKPNQLLARLIIMLNEPFGRNQPGVNILRALYCLSPNIHPDLVEVWSKSLPKLKRYLDSEDSFNQDQWENYLLSLVRDSIDAVNDDSWSVQFGDALLEQMRLYTGMRSFKKTLLSILGLVIQKTNLKEFIHRAVGELFDGTDHASDIERLGCARGLGQAAAVNTDVVLTKLQTMVKTQEKKQSGGWFSSKPTGPSVSGGAKASALLTYGYVTMLTPTDLITSRVEVHIINNILPVLQGPASLEVKENGLRAIDLIGKAVHPNRLEKFVLKSRDDLIKVILSIMNPPAEPNAKPDPNIHRLRSLGLEALSTLIGLPLTINIDVQTAVLNGTLNIFKTNIDDKTTEELLIQNLDAMLNAILIAEPTQGTLDDLLRALEPYLRSRNELERSRAASTYVVLLKDFARIISEEKPDNDALNSCGRIVAKLVPRITESNIDVRMASIDGIYVALRIHYYLKLGTGTELPEHIQKLGPLRGKLDVSEPMELFAVAKELAGILTEAIDAAHFATVIEALLDTLDDVEIDGANGSCVILNGLIRTRGSELENETVKFVKKIIEIMAQLKDREQIVTGLLHAIRGFARNFPLPVINALIAMPVPHSTEVIKAFQILATDPKLVYILMDHLLDIINNSQLYEEKKKGGESKIELIPTHNPKSCTCALAEVLDVPTTNRIALEYYPKIVMTTLLRLGSANAMTTDPPAKDSQVALKNFFTCTEDEEILKKIEKAELFPKMIGNEYADAIQDTLHIVCTAHPEHIPAMFEFSKQFISRTFIGHRIPATCIVSVLLFHMKNDRDMIYAAINALLGRSGTDEQVVVKLHALRGLANLTQHPKDVMHRYVTPVVGAMIANLEDLDESVIMQAMKSVSQIFEVAEDEFIAPLLLNLCVRLRPSFEKSNPIIREASIQLFGSLARFCQGVLSDTLINNIHNNLPTILLHLQDNDVTVVRTCKKALRQLVAELGSKPLIELFDCEQLDVKSTPEQDAKASLQLELVDFDEFSEKFAAVWVKEFPDRISDIVMNLVVFFKSDWAGVTAGSCLITGHIIAKINSDQKQRVNLRHTCTSMVALLKSPSALIREKVSMVLGLMFEA